MSESIKKIYIKAQIDKDSVDDIIKLLSENNLKSIKSSKKVISAQKKRFEPFYNHDFFYSKKEDQTYIFIGKKDDQYIQVIINLYRKNPETDFEVFTADVDKAKFYKDIYNFRLLKYDLLYPIETSEVKEETDHNKKSFDRYLNEENELKKVQDVVVKKIDTEMENLLKEKLRLISENKELYKSLKKGSEDFYSSGQKEEISEYKELFQKTLKTIEDNKNKIIDLSNKINLLQKKITLYRSRVFITYNYSALEIRSLEKEEGEKYEVLQKKEKETAAVTKKMIVPKKKLGGHLYDLEYLEIPETFSRSIEHKFEKIKKQVKKNVKKQDKSVVLSQYTFLN